MQNTQLQQQLQVRGYPTVWFVSATKTADAKVNLNALGSSGYVAAVSYTHLTLPTNREV